MEIRAIRVAPNTRQKYVLVRTLRGETESLLLWGNPNITWHKDIADEMEKAGYEIVEVLGGGWMLPKPEEDVFYVWGKSDRYGLAPMDLVRGILQNKVIEQEPDNLIA